MIPDAKLTPDKLSVQHLSWAEAIHLWVKSALKPPNGCAYTLPDVTKSDMLHKLKLEQQCSHNYITGIRWIRC
jgi:hypothetical protein